MKNAVVLDIETQNSFDEVGSRDPKALKISLVGVYFFNTNEYQTYLESELPALFKQLESVERVIGFNLKGFDYPVMSRYWPQIHKIQYLDIMEEMELFLGRRCSLNSVARATLNTSKSGDGLEAIQLWRRGEISKLKSYCLDDVRITKEVYEYGLIHSELLTTNFNGEKIKVPVNFKKTLGQTAAINLQLLI